MIRRTSDDRGLKLGVIAGAVLTIFWWLVLIAFWCGIGFVAYHFLNKWW